MKAIEKLIADERLDEMTDNRLADVCQVLLDAVAAIADGKCDFFQDVAKEALAKAELIAKGATNDQR